jgi:hypothetical protein
MGMYERTSFQRTCRGSGDGMQAKGTMRNTGSPSGDRSVDQRATRERLARPYGMAERHVGQGRIIRIANGVAEEIVSGLNVPTGMALDCHDDIYVGDLGAAPGTAGRILRFANPISGQPLTTIEVRKPAPLNRENGVDDGDEN